MFDTQLPDLTLSMVGYGAWETPFDLRCLLYKGSGRLRRNDVNAAIDAGQLGPPILERVELVTRLHSVFETKLAGGGSKETANTRFSYLRAFFRWADESDHSLNLDTAGSAYRLWSDSLKHRVDVDKDYSEVTAYSAANAVSGVLSESLGRRKALISTTRLRSPTTRKHALSVKADKQNLEETFAFGHVMLDICDGLCLETIWGPLPVRIALRNGETLVHWSGLPKPGVRISSNLDPMLRLREARKSEITRKAWEEDRTFRTRYSIINLRIQAEMMVFVSQTGMNIGDVHQLRLEQYSYESYNNGYRVRGYKSRRQGAVLFEIFADYKEIFERYIEWRAAIFSNYPSEYLFPLIRKSRHVATCPSFTSMAKVCNTLGLKLIGPQALRSTRVNWLLRRSRDPDLTAAMSQHFTETLINVYERPSLQVAMSEVSRFWELCDPNMAPPGPGICVGSGPSPVPDMPDLSTKPDCITPAGCLWCQHQRDIDSLDHVWSLCSYRFLKTLELGRFRPPVPGKIPLPDHPAKLAVERISAKLHFFRESSEVRAQWVEEGLARIEEGSYHPDWVGLIDIEHETFKK